MLKELPYQPKKYVEKSWIKLSKYQVLEKILITIETESHGYVNIEFVISKDRSLREIFKYVKH